VHFRGAPQTGIDKGFSALIVPVQEHLYDRRAGQLTIPYEKPGLERSNSIGRVCPGCCTWMLHAVINICGLGHGVRCRKCVRVLGRLTMMDAGPGSGTRDWQTMAAGDVPPYHELLLPALQAVGELGGSASISEIVETVIKHEGFSDAQQAVLHNDGPETEIGYRLAWARTYLKGMGLLTNSLRGVWALTDEGTALLTDPSATDDQRSERIQELRARYLTEMRTARKARLPQDDGEPDDVQSSTERSWKEQLLEQLMKMAPDAFERLARRLLREADFDSVNVTGQSGDGGIDGLGVYRLGLVSFPVFFQCKRYRGSVSPSAVRDFRGAMAGRGDKGLLITTGTFTPDAKKEATVTAPRRSTSSTAGASASCSSGTTSAFARRFEQSRMLGSMPPFSQRSKADVRTKPGIGEHP
jgi:restriction system protein